MNRNKRAGFTLVEIMIVVAIIGLLAAIAIPSLIKARTETQRKMIVNNLRLIEDAVDQAMTVSNYAVVTDIAADSEIEAFLKAGTIPEMGWPKSVVPPTLAGIQAAGGTVSVTFLGETITTGR